MIVPRHPREALGLVVVTLVLLGGAVGLGLQLHALRRTNAELSRQRREWTRLCQLPVAPTEANRDLVAVELALAGGVVRAWRKRLAREAASIEGSVAPVDPVKGYFALQDKLSALRRRARQNRVLLGGNGQFGFTEFAREAPAPAQLEVVHLQSEVIRVLLQLLFECGPEVLLDVKRTALDPQRAVPAAGVTGDYFAVDPMCSLHRPPLVCTIGVQLTFVAAEDVALEFAQRATAPGMPFSIRELGIQPLAPGDSTEILETADDGAGTAARCCYIMAIEYLRVSEAPEGEKP